MGLLQSGITRKQLSNRKTSVSYVLPVLPGGALAPVLRQICDVQVRVDRPKRLDLFSNFIFFCHPHQKHFTFSGAEKLSSFDWKQLGFLLWYLCWKVPRCVFPKLTICRSEISNLLSDFWSFAAFPIVHSKTNLVPEFFSPDFTLAWSPRSGASRVYQVPCHVPCWVHGVHVIGW